MAPPPQTRVEIRPWSAVLPLLALAGAALPRLALPAAFALFIAYASLARLRERGWWRPGAMLLVALPPGLVGLGRFVVSEAVPGIIQGGRQAVQKRAVSRLRGILSAQDSMRRSGWIDPDGDGIGSAAFLPELCGGAPQRGQAVRAAPVLRCGSLEASPVGPAMREGAYRYAVCLPTLEGGFSARLQARVDEERAERRFVAYAWPDEGSSFTSTYAIDEHDRILVRSVPSGTPVPAPTCESALVRSGARAWLPWRGKEPRAALPGDAPGDPP